VQAAVRGFWLRLHSIEINWDYRFFFFLLAGKNGKKKDSPTLEKNI